MKALAPRRARRREFTPWRELDVFGQLPRLMGVEWPEMETEGLSDWVPAVDLAEDNDAFKLSADLPGIKPEEVEVSIEGKMLTIRGERKEERKEKDGKWRLWERSYGSFERCIMLPHDVDEDNVKAAFKDGVLEVSLPKRAEEKAHRIEIGA